MSELHFDGMERYGHIVLDDSGENPANPAGLPEPDGFDAEDLAAIMRVVPVVLRLPDDHKPVEWAWRGEQFILGGNLDIYRSDGAAETLSHHLKDGFSFEWVDYADSDRFDKETHPEVDS